MTFAQFDKHKLRPRLSHVLYESVTTPEDSAKTRQTRALQYLALAAVVGLLWLARPVGVGLFLGMLLAFTLQPLYDRLRKKKKWGPQSAGLVCVLATVVIVVASVAGLAVLFITRGVSLAQKIPPLIASGGPLRKFAERAMTAMHVDPESVFGHLQEQAMSFGAKAAGIAAGIASVTFTGFLVIFMMALAMYYVLRHWSEIVHKAEIGLPFNPKHTRELLGHFRKAGSLVLRGTVVTGAVQGVLAGIGYWITGLPYPLFFGAMTAVASLVPAVGTLLIWIPAGIYLIASGHPAGGIAELIYSALIVGIVTDYVIRPKLVGGDSGVPTVVTFVSLFGGAEIFGVIGLIIGPIIATLCVAILSTYEQELLEQRELGRKSGGSGDRVIG